jgi:hypothetical protein
LEANHHQNQATGRKVRLITDVTSTALAQSKNSGTRETAIASKQLWHNIRF